MFDLTGRKGIVTGGSGGIGLAVANALAGAGASVRAFSRSGRPKDPDAAADPRIVHTAVDVRDRTALAARTEEAARAEGGIDFLINNAGITVKCRAEEFREEDFDAIHDVNVKSVFRLSCLCYPHLRLSPHRGRIVNITSMAAHLGFSQVVPYCSSKGAVLAMTRGLAVEWAGDNICVNSIAPGWFPSAMNRQVMDPERREKILARMPLHRFGDPRDIGAMAVFLVSDAAGYITGQDYAVDGGALAYGF